MFRLQDEEIRVSGFFLDDIEIGNKSQRAVNAINDIIGCLRPAENYITIKNNS